MKSAKQNPLQESMKDQPENALLSKPTAAINLRGLFIVGLKDMYWAEKALTKALSKMVKNTTSSELTYALKNHLEETKIQVNKLESIFISIDEKATARKCVAMEGLINEADQIMEATGQGAVRDAGIIAAAQKIEHYEIVSYGTLANFARTLEEEDAESILEEILAEEKEADEALSTLAESTIMDQANNKEEVRKETILDAEDLDDDFFENTEEQDLDEYNKDEEEEMEESEEAEDDE